MPDANDLLARVNAVYTKFKDAVDHSAPNRALFLEDMDRTHETTRKLIAGGLLGDPANDNMYFLVSSDGEHPKFITKRGSNQLEALWRALENICTGAMCGAETIDRSGRRSR